MIIEIDPAGAVPIYQQIRDRVVEAVADGLAPAGSPLPSTRQLAADLGVNFHTVNKAYDMLRQEGLLLLGRSTGAVVRRDAASGPPGPAVLPGWTARLRTLLAEAAAHGVTADEILARCADVVAGFTPPAPDVTGGSS